MGSRSMVFFSAVALSGFVVCPHVDACAEWLPVAVPPGACAFDRLVSRMRRRTPLLDMAVALYPCRAGSDFPPIIILVYVRC